MRSAWVRGTVACNWAISGTLLFLLGCAGQTAPPADTSASAGGGKADCATPCKSGFVCGQGGTCVVCKHECPEWGATCAGNELSTCVYDTDGCRKLITQSCSLGCESGSCTTCSTISDPKIGVAGNDESAFYRGIAAQNGTAITEWEQRNGVYTEPTNGLTTFDASTPAAIKKSTVNQLSTNWNEPRSLNWVGNRLYFLNNTGFEIYDTSSSLAPTRIGGYLGPTEDITSDLSIDVDGDGTIACVSSLTKGVDLVDLSVSPPVRVGTLNANASHVRCAGNFAAVLAGNIQVWNIANPKLPVLAAQANSTEYDALYFDGARLIARNFTNFESGGTLEDWTFSPPDQLKLAGQLAGIGTNIFNVQGDRLYFGNTTSVGEVDLSDFTNPKWNKVVALEGGASAVAFDGTTLFAAQDGVTTFDLSQTNDLSLSSASTDGWLAAFVMKGSIAYRANRNNFVIEDRSDPTKPVILSRIPINAESISLTGSTAVVSVADGNSQELRLYDIECPWRPVLIGSLALGLGVDGNEETIGLPVVEHGKVYASCDWSACVVDISTSASPKLLATVDLGQFDGGRGADQIGVYDGYLVFATEDQFYVVDLNNPSAPKLSASIPLPGDASPSSNFSLRVAGTTAYILRACPATADPKNSCLDVIDFSKPSSPVVQTELQVHPTFGAFELNDEPMQLLGSWLVIRESTSHGAVFIDVSTPSAPKVFRELWTQLYPGEAIMSDRYLSFYSFSNYTSQPGESPTDEEQQQLTLCR